MRIFTEQALKEYAENHPDSKVALQEWTTICLLYTSDAADE